MDYDKCTGLVFFAPAIAIIGIGTAAGLTHMTFPLANAVFSIAIPLLTASLIVFAIARSRWQKAAEITKDSDLTMLWLSASSLFAVAVMISGTTALLSRLWTTSMTDSVMKLFFVLFIALWTSLAALAIQLSSNFWDALIDNARETLGEDYWILHPLESFSLSKKEIHRLKEG